MTEEVKVNVSINIDEALRKLSRLDKLIDRVQNKRSIRIGGSVNNSIGGNFNSSIANNSARRIGGRRSFGLDALNFGTSNLKQFSQMAGKAGGALAGIGVAVFAATKAIEAFSGAVKHVGEELVSGVMKIGGGLNISEIMNDAANAELTAARISGNYGANATFKMNKNELMNFAIKQGGHLSQNEVLSAVAKFQEKTGNIEGFIKNFDLYKKISTTTGMELNEVASFGGTIQTQHESLTPKQLESIILRAYESGKSGAVELPQFAEAGKDLSGAIPGLVAGDKANTIVTGYSMLQNLAKNYTPEEANTAIVRFLERGFNDKVTRSIGKQYGTVVDPETGEQRQKITDVAKYIAEAVYLNATDPQKALKVFDQRAIKAPRAFGNLISPKENESREEFVKRAKKLFEEELSGKKKSVRIMDDLNQSYANVSNTAAIRLKEAFNKVKNSLGTRLLDTLEKRFGSVEDAVKALGDAIPAVINIFETMVDAIPAFIIAIKAFAATVEFIANSLGIGLDKPQFETNLDQRGEARIKEIKQTEQIRTDKKKLEESLKGKTKEEKEAALTPVLQSPDVMNKLVQDTISAIDTSKKIEVDADKAASTLEATIARALASAEITINTSNNRSGKPIK